MAGLSSTVHYVGTPADRWLTHQVVTAADCWLTHYAVTADCWLTHNVVLLLLQAEAVGKHVRACRRTVGYSQALMGRRQHHAGPGTQLTPCQGGSTQPTAEEGVCCDCWVKFCILSVVGACVMRGYVVSLTVVGSAALGRHRFSPPPGGWHRLPSVTLFVSQGCFAHAALKHVSRTAPSTRPGTRLYSVFLEKTAVEHTHCTAPSACAHMQFLHPLCARTGEQHRSTHTASQAAAHTTPTLQ